MSLTTLHGDPGEFHAVRWFDFASIPYERTDPNLSRFIRKLEAADSAAHFRVASLS